MNDENLKERLQRAYRAVEVAPPEFEAVWAAAELQARRRPPWRAIAAGIAAVAAVTLFGLSQRPDRNDFSDAWVAGIDETLLNTTAWTVPSDALLPGGEPDLYSTLPALPESTEMEVETLL